MFELVLLWAIVIATVVWFVRDERRLKAEAALSGEAKYYAHTTRYRDVTPALLAQPVTVPQQPVAPTRRTGGLTETQRRFMANYAALN